MSDVEAAVLSRGRRSTAGRRMGALVGKALENDDAFWSHSTWMEDEDKRKHRENKKDDDDTSSEISSADESFDLDEEPEESRVDVFDSDFDESEDEESEGSDNEQAVLREEKQSKRAATKKKIAKLSVFSRKRKASVINKKKLMGSEHNAGLVLKLPGDTGDSSVKKVALAIPPVTTSIPINLKQNIVAPAKPTKGLPTLAATRARRGAKSQYQRATTTTPTKTVDTTSITKKKSAKRKFTQEELLIESIHETEPANERWLLGRRRVEALSDLDAKKKAERMGNGSRDVKVVMKYHSLKGCLNTLTFPDMDHVPAMFRRKTDTSVKDKKKNSGICIITGKKARYRDPLTGESYHDLDAFRELGRRYNKGLPLDQEIDDSDDDNDYNIEQCNNKPPSGDDTNHSPNPPPPSHDVIHDQVIENAPSTSQSLHDNGIHKHNSLPIHSEELYHLSTEDYILPTNTDTNNFPSVEDDIGDSKDIDIDDLFQTEQHSNISASSTNENANEINDVNNETISCIVTPPQTFNNDFMSSSSNVKKRSFEKESNKSSTSSSSSHVSSNAQQFIIAS